MDTQRKKGMLDVCVLAILSRGPSYGYLIIGEVSKCIEISESTLYPILKRLEQSGSLVTYRQEYNGRTRKYYEITDAGRRKIREFLNEWEEMKQIYHFIAKQSVLESEEKTADAEANQTEAVTAEAAADETEIAAAEAAVAETVTVGAAAAETEAVTSETAAESVSEE